MSCDKTKEDTGVRESVDVKGTATIYEKIEVKEEVGEMDHVLISQGATTAIGEPAR